VCVCVCVCVRELSRSREAVCDKALPAYCGARAAAAAAAKHAKRTQTHTHMHVHRRRRSRGVCILLPEPSLLVSLTQPTDRKGPHVPSALAASKR
jgi:hypothetical protein